LSIFVVPCFALTGLLPVQKISLANPVQAKGFGTFAPFLQNGFVALGNCFMTVSRPQPVGLAKKNTATV
jgi:hypothetical protein